MRIGTLTPKHSASPPLTKVSNVRWRYSPVHSAAPIALAEETTIPTATTGHDAPVAIAKC
jgi:hypothetical protein